MITRRQSPSSPSSSGRVRARAACGLLVLAGAITGLAATSCGEDEVVPARRTTRGGSGGAAGRAAGGASGANGGGAGGATAGAAGTLGAAGLAGGAGATGGAGGLAGFGGAGGAGTGGQNAGTGGAAGASPAGSGGTTSLAGMGGSGVAGTTGSGEVACVDGSDNDGDGQTDCADADCVGRAACLPVVPPDWTGPLTTIKKPVSIDPAPCANGAAPQRRFLTPGGPVHCSACSCGDRTGASCKLGEVVVAAGVSPDTACATGSAIDPTSATCGEFPASQDPGVAVKASLAETKGSCPPAGGIVDNRPPVFQDAYDTCPLPGSGTGCAGNLCVPITNEAQTCILQKGTTASCPTGWNTRVVVYGGSDDQRDCTACTCADPPTVCTSGKLTLHKTAACTVDTKTDPKPTVDVDGQCRYLNVNDPFPNTKWHFVASGLSVASTTCSPQGGVPTGEVVAQDGSVLCCL